MVTSPAREIRTIVRFVRPESSLCLPRVVPSDPRNCTSARGRNLIKPVATQRFARHERRIFKNRYRKQKRGLKERLYDTAACIFVHEFKEKVYIYLIFDLIVKNN